MGSILALGVSLDLGAPFGREVIVTDSSDHGYAALVTNASLKEHLSAWSFRERWRFRSVAVPMTAPHSMPDDIFGGTDESRLGFAPDEWTEPQSCGVGPKTAMGRWLASVGDKSIAQVKRGRRRAKRIEIETVEIEVQCAIPALPTSFDHMS